MRTRRGLRCSHCCCLAAAPAALFHSQRAPAQRSPGHHPAQARTRQHADHRARHHGYRVGRGLLHRWQLHVSHCDPLHAPRVPRLVGTHRIQRRFDSLSYNSGQLTSATASAAPRPAWCTTAISWISRSRRRSAICCAAIRACAPAPPPSHATMWAAAARADLHLDGRVQSFVHQSRGHLRHRRGYGFRLKPIGRAGPPDATL